MLDSIVDFLQSTTGLCYEDQTFVKNGRSYKRRSTKVWKLCCQWKDGSTSWQKLADLKESHPVEVAEYSISQDLQSEPALNWWVTHVIKKRDVIISLVKKRSARYLKKMHKFGVWLPKSVQEAYKICKETNSQMWNNAIDKEMKDSRVALQSLDKGEPIPIG